MKSRASILLGLASLVCLSAFAPMAAGAGASRVLITDPNELVRMGFPANATHVYRSAIAPDGAAIEGQPVGDFGTVVQYTALAPKAFIGRQNLAGTPWQYDGGDEGCCGNLSRKGAELFADAQLSLPNGALLNGIRFWANDSNASGDLLFFVFESCFPPFAAGATNNNVISSTGTGTSGSSGNQSNFFNLTSTTIDNESCVYTVRARFEDINGLTLQKLRFQWFRQITPGPAVASFTDVPTNAQFFAEVEALAASGITSGCTATTFCPDNFVTRRQMAAFLSRALGL